MAAAATRMAVEPRREPAARVFSSASGPGPRTAHQLLDWYDRERRELPWRFAPDEVADAYRVWLSEIMLQQTTVKAVVPYYERFVKRWPTVKALARARQDDILAEWAGLGYYSRARNLHACAKLIVKQHAGRFPAREADLRLLPGIGPYTAAAIAAIAYGQAATPVDGNIERVVARLFAVETALPAAKPELRRLAATLTPGYRAGDYAQAMMDLGATVCTPRRPSCLMCPLAGGCRAQALGVQGVLPARTAKAARPTRYAVAFVALREDGHILLRRRPAAGLLGGMLEVPSTDWGDEWRSAEEALLAAPVRGDWWPVPGAVVHVFTHFRLEAMVYRALIPPDAALNLWAEPARCTWVPRREIDAQALPSVMRKLIGHACR